MNRNSDRTVLTGRRHPDKQMEMIGRQNAAVQCGSCHDTSYREWKSKHWRNVHLKGAAGPHSGNMEALTA
jgi:hypothetical protein